MGKAVYVKCLRSVSNWQRQDLSPWRMALKLYLKLLCQTVDWLMHEVTGTTWHWPSRRFHLRKRRPRPPKRCHDRCLFRLRRYLPEECERWWLSGGVSVEKGRMAETWRGSRCLECPSFVHWGEAWGNLLNGFGNEPVLSLSNYNPRCGFHYP